MNFRAPSLTVQLVASFAFAIAVFATLIALAWSSPYRGVDLDAYLVGATLLERGQDPYTADEALLQATAKELSLGTGTYRYRYPIHLALLLKTLPPVPPATLWLAMAALNSLAALMAAVLVGLSIGGPRNVPLALCLAGASGTNIETILFGNVTGFLLLALAAGFWALQRSSRTVFTTAVFATAVPLGVALKLLPIVLLPIALARRQYRMAAYGLVATVVLFLAPLAFVGVDSSLLFFRNVGDIVTTPGFYTNNQSILAVFNRLGLPEVIATMARCLVFVLLGWMFLRCWMKPSPQRTGALFAAALCGALLVPNYSSYMYQLWLLFPLLFALDFLWDLHQRWLATLLLGFYFFCQSLFVLPQLLYRIAPAYFSPPQSPFEWLGSYPAFFCIALFLINLWIGLRHADAPESHVAISTNA